MVQERVLPDKKYFKIGETSSLLGVKPHVLRYWETEFPQIRPCKSKTGQRMYRRRDVEALIKIQKLLYQERFTIAGAKQALRSYNWADISEEESGKIEVIEEVPLEHSPAEVKALEEVMIDSKIISGLASIRKELQAVLKMVEESPSETLKV